MNTPVSLADFARGPRKDAAQTSSRVAAAVLTAALYGLLALLALAPVAAPQALPTVETIAILLPAAKHKRIVEPPPFLAHLLRPHAEKIAAPSFTVATATPAPATLPVSATPVSPMPGGIPAATGTGTAGGTAGTGNGNGKDTSGCYDAIWGRAVSDRIGQFYHFPFGQRRARGLVMVDFTVRRDGWVNGLKVGVSSGNRDLDRAAYDTVKQALPLPPIPDRMHVSTMTVELPIGFNLDDAGLHPAVGSCG